MDMSSVLKSGASFGSVGRRVLEDCSMKKHMLMAAAASLLALPVAANAAVLPVLDTVTLVGTDYEFSYSGTLSGDTGLVLNDLLIIYDFAGYVDGSISAGIYAADVSATTELTSALAPLGFDDDPLLVNLVFRWINGPFNASGGPFADVSFAGLTARSVYSGTALDGYVARTTINNGAATGQKEFNSGAVAVAAAVPEPATWAMMILGFGGVGAMLRRRSGFTFA
jgi:hypothetical protein